MPNPDKILLTRPAWEVATKACSEWFRLVKIDAESLGIEVIDLFGEDVSKSKVDQAIIEHDPIYFAGAGHGNEDVFAGYCNDYLFETCKCDNLSGRDVYLLSCLTAQRLGPDIITKGGLSYGGYWVSYTFYLEDRQDIGVNTGLAFCDTSNLISYLYARGATRDFALRIVKEAAMKWIMFLEGFPEGAQIIKWLNHNYLKEPDGVLCGDKNRRRTEELTHNPVIQLIRSPRVIIDTPSKCKILVTCPQGCILVGYMVQLFDDGRNIIAEVPLTDFSNGLNSSEYIEFTLSALGVHEWKARLIGDETHPTTDSLPLAMKVYELGILKGRALDLETGQPISNVRIRDRMSTLSLYTGEEGKYRIEFKAPVSINLIASKEHYITKSKTIQVVGGENTFDFILMRKPIYTLTINSMPVGGITLRQPRGKTPVEVEVESGDHISVYVTKEDVVNGKKYIFNRWNDGTTNLYRWQYIHKDEVWTAIYVEEQIDGRRGLPSESTQIILDPKIFWAVEDSIGLAEDEEETVLSISLNRASFEGGESMIISGKLTFKADSNPLAGRTIELYENNVKVNSTTTDINGEYSLSHVAPIVEVDTKLTYKTKFQGD